MQETPLAENLPAGQTMQSSTLSSEGYLPGLHSTQLASLSARSWWSPHATHVPLDWNRPPAQALQLLAPGPEKVPAAQFSHVTKVRFAYLPAAQDTHSVWMMFGTRPAGHGSLLQCAAPTAPMTWPTGQGWQPTCASERDVPTMQGAHWPSATWLQWPSAHGTHKALPITEYVPALQLMHCTAPVEFEYVPEVHIMQVDWPVAVWCRPTGHAPQPIEPSVEDLPTGQAVHVVAPAAEKVPAVQ